MAGRSRCWTRRMSRRRSLSWLTRLAWFMWLAWCRCGVTVLEALARTVCVTFEERLTLRFGEDSEFVELDWNVCVTFEVRLTFGDAGVFVEVAWNVRVTFE